MAVTPEVHQAFLDAVQAGNTDEAVALATPLEKVLATPKTGDVFYPAFGGNAVIFRKKLKQDLEPEGDEVIDRIDGGITLHQKITVVGLNPDITDPNNFSSDDLVDSDYEMYINFGPDNFPETVVIGQKPHPNPNTPSAGMEIPPRVIRYNFSEKDENGATIPNGGKRLTGWESYIMVDNQFQPIVTMVSPNPSESNYAFYGEDTFGKAWDTLQFALIPRSGSLIDPNTNVRPLTDADIAFLESGEAIERGIVTRDVSKPGSPDTYRVNFTEVSPGAVDKMLFVQKDSRDGNLYPTRLSWTNLHFESFDLRGEWNELRNVRGARPERYLYNRTTDVQGNPIYGPRTDAQALQNP